MRSTYRFLSVSVLFLCTTLILSVCSVYASIPVLKDVTKLRANNSQAAIRTPVATRIVSSSKPSNPVLGRAFTISDVKKRVGPLVTEATTRKLNRKISSRCAIIIDAESEIPLYEKNPDTPRQPASTIKVITGMIALKALKQTATVPVSHKAARQPRSKVYLDQRKHYKANDLINAVLLASANDASVAIAEKIAGSEDKFAKMMTQHAKRWGAKRTICKTASGLTAKGQKSTARDLATIFRYAMQDPEFSRRMKRSKIRTSYGKLLRNHNKALWQVDGTLGGKTGYTNAARQTYVGKFKRGSDEIIVAIMGSETMWYDLKRLVTYGFQKKVALNRENQALGNDIKLVAEL